MITQIIDPPHDSLQLIKGPGMAGKNNMIVLRIIAYLKYKNISSFYHKIGIRDTSHSKYLDFCIISSIFGGCT